MEQNKFGDFELDADGGIWSSHLGEMICLPNKMIEDLKKAITVSEKLTKKKIIKYITKKGKIVNCYACGKPMTSDTFGGLLTVKGVKGHFFIHNNKFCVKKWMGIKEKMEMEVCVGGGK